MLQNGSCSLPSPKRMAISPVDQSVSSDEFAQTAEFSTRLSPFPHALLLPLSDRFFNCHTYSSTRSHSHPSFADPSSTNTRYTQPHFLSPQHKKEDQDLHSGWLQVPKGSLYLVTEAGITEGPVDSVGLDNIRSLQQVMTSQILDYESPFTRFPLTTDLSVMILTQGKTSALFQVSDYFAAFVQLY